LLPPPFFIVLKDSPFLDGQYTVFGRVISGMEFVDKIKKGNPSQNGTVINPDKIISMAIASDVEAIKLKNQ
jgi:peptidylprolyl isomerase